MLCDLYRKTVVVIEKGIMVLTITVFVGVGTVQTE